MKVFAAALFAALAQAIQLDDAVLTISGDCDVEVVEVFTVDSTETVNPALTDSEGTLVPRCDRNVITATGQLSVDLWCALNDMRAHPTDYIPEVNRQIALFTDPENPDTMVDPDTLITYQRGAGVEAWIGFKEFLATVEPMEELMWNEDLFESAHAHLLDMQATGSKGKNGSDGTAWADEIAKYYTKASKTYRAQRNDC